MIKIAIVDDDSNMLSIVENRIRQIPECGEDVSISLFENAESALEHLEKNDIFDIVISDIEMEGIQGLEFGEVVRKKHPEIFLIFLTAFPHYAVKSYAINAHQYVLKEEMEDRLSEVVVDMVRQLRAKQKKYRNVIKGNEIKKLDYDDILYIRKVKGAKYIQYATANGEYQERISLEQILEELGGREFMMIERGFIVNIAHIDSVKGRSILLDNGEMLSISRGRYGEVRERLHMFWREQL